MQKVGIIGPIEFVLLAHNIARSSHSPLAGLEHLHWWTDQVAYGIDVGNARAHMLIYENFTFFPDCYPKYFPVVFGAGPLTRGDKHEITWQRLLATGPHIANDDCFYIAMVIILNRHRLAPLENLYSSFAHAINHVCT